MIGGSPISYPPQGYLSSPPPYAVVPAAPLYPGSTAPVPRPIVRAVPEDDPPRRQAFPESPPRRPLVTLPPPEQLGIATPTTPSRGSVAPTPVTLPPPEELGIGLPRPAAAGNLDWNPVHGRLRQLGSLNFQLQKLPEGGFRFICLLPTTQPDQPRRFEACAATEREAVQAVLTQAEQWAAVSGR